MKFTNPSQHLVMNIGPAYQCHQILKHAAQSLKLRTYDRQCGQARPAVIEEDLHRSFGKMALVCIFPVRDRMIGSSTGGAIGGTRDVS